jgi:hypothetical protein
MLIYCQSIAYVIEDFDRWTDGMRIEIAKTGYLASQSVTNTFDCNFKPTGRSTVLNRFMHRLVFSLFGFMGLMLGLGIASMVRDLYIEQTQEWGESVEIIDWFFYASFGAGSAIMVIAGIYMFRVAVAGPCEDEPGLVEDKTNEGSSTK